MSIVCVDAGTTVIKAVRYDEDGQEVATARRPAKVERRHPGWAEQDMDSVWEAVVDCLREVLAGAVAPDVLAVTAQGDGAWLVDAGGCPTGPAVLWNDGRAAAEVAAWERDGTLAAAYSINGSRVSTGMPNAVLAWMRTHDPDRLSASTTLLTCGGWLFSRLTGERAVDESDASAPFLDIRARTWSPDLLALYGFADGLERLLPDLRDDDHRAAGLTVPAASELGIPPGLPVVMAPYDICATALGAGAVTPGDACLILGTTLSTEVVVDHVPEPVPRTEPSGITVALGAPERWLRAFPTMAGGDVLEWAAAVLGTDVKGLLALAEQASTDAAGVRFLPYLSPAGERNPFFDPSARGALTGLSLDAGPADLARAVVEGLTMTVRECLDAAGATPTSLALCGGGAASPWWASLIADVTGVPVVRSTDRQVGARGAHLVAQVATGAAPDLASAVHRHLAREALIPPDPARTERFDEHYAQFLELRRALVGTWPRTGPE